MNFPDTRDQALARLHKFVRHVGRYSSNRNHVIPHHGNVSCLSAAIRHRLLTEWEVAEAPLTHYAASTVEKFTQEVYWRTYWKGWLSLRPQVWDDYLEGIEEHPDAEEIRQGKGPVAVMNRFARELVETGYLHNHSRMWFAAYWVHVARLPWQLGAKIFSGSLTGFRSGLEHAFVAVGCGTANARKDLFAKTNKHRKICGPGITRSAWT